VKATKEGVVLDPSAVADRRTEAEKKASAWEGAWAAFPPLWEGWPLRWSCCQLRHAPVCTVPPAPPRPSNTIHKQAEEHFLKYEAQRAKKIASKSHRERIKELNEVRG